MSDSTCDECQGPMPTIVAAFTRRPSDPTDLCSILWFCEWCAARKGWEGVDYVFPADRKPCLATFSQVERWIEEHGQFRREDPILFVT